MEKRLHETAKKHIPKDMRRKHALLAFLSGGTLGLLAELLVTGYEQIFSLSHEEALPLMIVSFMAVAAILTGLGYFDRLAQLFGAGVFIPITGFANALASCALEGKKEGLIYGIGSNMFQLAGSVLTYGVVSAYLMGMFRYLVFGG